MSNYMYKNIQSLLIVDTSIFTIFFCLNRIENQPTWHIRRAYWSQVQHTKQHCTITMWSTKSVQSFVQILYNCVVVCVKYSGTSIKRILRIAGRNDEDLHYREVSLSNGDLILSQMLALLPLLICFQHLNKRGRYKEQNELSLFRGSSTVIILKFY